VRVKYRHFTDWKEIYTHLAQYSVSLILCINTNIMHEARDNTVSCFRCGEVYFLYKNIIFY